MPGAGRLAAFDGGRVWYTPGVPNPGAKRPKPDGALMLAWPPRLFRRPTLPEAPADPVEERAVAERLLPVARGVLAVPGAEGRAELLELLEQHVAPQRAEILTPPDLDIAVVERLLARGFPLFDAAAAPRTSILILDRRLGWRLPAWQPLPDAQRLSYRVLWTRLGYYTVQSGTVEEVHPENGLFSFVGRTTWVNTAYRDLPLPSPGEQLRVLGMFSFLGSTLPILHALTIEPAAA